MEAIKSGQVGGAALDVFKKEPVSEMKDPIMNELIQHDKVISTPHLGFENSFSFDCLG